MQHNNLGKNKNISVKSVKSGSVFTDIKVSDWDWGVKCDAAASAAVMSLK